jgi:hypothetical protein
MRTIKLTLTLITLAGLISVVGLVYGTSSKAAAMPEGSVNVHWKGFASFSPTGAGPNVARCGEFPENVEVTFAGSGIDNEGGILTNTVSACLNTTKNEVSDLKATDTFATGDQIHIESDPFVQIVDPSNCAITNSHAIGFRVAGGTGKYAGASGHGRYHIAGNHTPCNGVTVPNSVWFEGVFQRP